VHGINNVFVNNVVTTSARIRAEARPPKSCRKLLYNLRVCYFQEKGVPFMRENTTNQLLNLKETGAKAKKKKKKVVV